MNGAESLVRTLLDEGVDVCFTNPGTSEMHFVAALDRVPGMRCVLGLFEGVVTGAAWAMKRLCFTSSRCVARAASVSMLMPGDPCGAFYPARQRARPARSSGTGWSG